jgi:hypothetical protein
VGTLLAASVTPAFAATTEPPDNIAEALAEAARACKDMDGTPNTDAVLKMEDINGDGGEDWIADYSKMKCEGASIRSAATRAARSRSISGMAGRPGTWCSRTS